MFSEISTATREIDVRQLDGWLPVDAVIRNDRPGLLWVDMRDVSLDEPFFADTVARRVQELPPHSQLFTDFDALLQFEKIYGRATPAGLIFHSSRCGSTAIANALKTLDNALVLSEPYIVDKLIARLFTDTRDSHTKELLYSILIRASVGALGQHANAKRFFLKFSATSGLQLPRLQKTWPTVPWVLIYRDPLEVMVSNFRERPTWLDHQANVRMASELIQADEAETRNMSSEEFCARVLGRLFETVSKNLRQSSKLINYSQLSPATILRLANHFGVSPDEQERQNIEASLRFYSKDKSASRLFAADSIDKQSAASQTMIEAVVKWTQAPYEQLESLRNQEC